MNNIPDMKEIPGHCYYYATKDGRIFSRAPYGGRSKPDKLRELKLSYMGKYLCVQLGQGPSYFVHRLVLLTYVGPANGLESRHLNGNPSDNRLENLAWGTRSENALDRNRHGTAAGLFGPGEDHPHSTLTEQDVNIIRALRSQGLPQREIASRFGIHQGTVSRIINRKRWTHI